jgi:asparagine synthase (glutamine-hydrolysing)
LKLRRGTGKHLLRELARGMIPDRVIDKPKVGFFNTAVDAWFTQQSSMVAADYLLQPEPRYAALLEPARVRSLLQAHSEGASPRSSRVLLAILMLEVWLSSYLPRASSPTSTGSLPLRIPT